MDTEESPLIMIVDDHEGSAELIETSLGENYHTLVAKSGEEAMESLQGLHPAVIVLDVVMGGMSGYEVCKKIRNSTKWPFTKVIMVSGHGTLEERLEGYEAGANDYLVKPFRQQELRAKVDTFVRLFETETELKRITGFLEEEVELRVNQVLRSERLAYIGMRSAEIVHNLRNPLSLVSGYAQKLERKYPDEPTFGKLVKAAEKMADIVKSILFSSRDSFEDEKRGVDLNDVLNAELKLFELEERFRYDIQKEIQLGEIPSFPCVPSHFGQIFNSVVRTALNAMDHAEEKTLSVTSGCDDGQIWFCVSDTGIGVGPEEVSQMFEPQVDFRVLNQEVGSRMSLGLCYAKRMVEAYGGSIDVDSAPGKKTTFTIRLSVSSEMEKAAG